LHACLLVAWFACLFVGLLLCVLLFGCKTSTTDLTSNKQRNSLVANQ
jgi:hypothetical protein